MSYVAQYIFYDITPVLNRGMELRANIVIKCDNCANWVMQWKIMFNAPPFVAGPPK